MRGRKEEEYWRRWRTKRRIIEVEVEKAEMEK